MSVVTLHLAVNNHHSILTPQQAAYLTLQIVQGIRMLGEDNELLMFASFIPQMLIFLKEP